ncbi:peptide deformylase [bacterium]|nr:MAG: peptide deformylase [bacterium]
MPETRLQIKLFGDPVLRKKAQAVREVSECQRDLLSKMVRLMYEQAGIGLAAPQVGINQSMIVIDIGDGLYKLVNPKIVKKEGTQIMQEGCLSVPGVCLNVKRAKRVEVEAVDEYGQPISLAANDLLARVLQHEIDHLHGKLIVDYASFLERLKLRNKLERIIKRTDDEKLPKSETKSCKLQL